MNQVQDGEGYGYYNDDKTYYSSSSSSQGYNGRKLSTGSNSSSKRDQHQRVSHHQHHPGRSNNNYTNGDDSLINSAGGAYPYVAGYHNQSSSSAPSGAGVSMKTPMKVNNKRNTNATAPLTSASSASSNHSQRKISSTSTTSSGSASVSPNKGSSSRRSAGNGSHSSQSPPSQAQEASKYKCLDCHETFVKWSHCLTHLRQAQHCPDKNGTPEGRRELQNLCMIKKDSVATNFSLDDDFISAAVAAATLSENANGNDSHSRSGRGGRMDDVDDDNLSRKLTMEPPSPLLSATDMSEFSVMMPVSLSPTVAYAVDSAAQVQWSQRYGISQMQPLNQFGSQQQTSSPPSNQHISWIPSSIGLKHHGVRSSSPGFPHQYSVSGQNTSPSSAHIPNNGYSQNHSPLSPTSLQQQQHQHQQQQQQLPRPMKSEVNNLLARERRSYSLEEPRGRGLSTSSCVSSPGDMVHADYIKMNTMPAQNQGNITYKYFCPTCTQPFQKWSHCLQHLRQSEHFGLLGSDSLRKIQALCAIDVRGLRSEFASPASRMDSPQLILQHKYYISNIMRGHYTGDHKNQQYQQSFHPYQQQEDYDESGDVLFALKSDKMDYGQRGDRKGLIRPMTLQGLPDKVAYLVNSFLNVDDMYNLFLALSKNDDLEFATSSRVRTWSGNTVTLSDDDDASFMGYE